MPPENEKVIISGNFESHCPAVDTAYWKFDEELNMKIWYECRCEGRYGIHRAYGYEVDYWMPLPPYHKG